MTLYERLLLQSKEHLTRAYLYLSVFFMFTIYSKVVFDFFSNFSNNIRCPVKCAKYAFHIHSYVVYFTDHQFVSNSFFVANNLFLLKTVLRSCCQIHFTLVFYLLRYIFNELTNICKVEDIQCDYFRPDSK